MSSHETTPSSELADTSRLLSSSDIKTQINGIRQVVDAFGQGKNCASLLSKICQIDPSKSLFEGISLIRFRNTLTDSYSLEIPELTHNIVSSILDDFQNPNRLIKSLAVKQAGSFASNETSNQLIPIIVSASQSDDSYIRKTAAMSILKVYQNSPVLIQRFKLAPVLLNLINDQNPNVAANAVSALMEINNSREQPIIDITSETLINLLGFCEDATEWAQCQILEFISEYLDDHIQEILTGNLSCLINNNSNDSENNSDDENVTENNNTNISNENSGNFNENNPNRNVNLIIQKLSTRLLQSNSGITMAAIRCCIKLCLFINDPHIQKDIINRISLPLISMMNNGYEIQYTVMKTLILVLNRFQLCRSIFSNDLLNNFLVKSNDPLYVKLIKLDIISLLVNEKNSRIVFSELEKYSTGEFMHEYLHFSIKTVKTINRIALNDEKLSSSCVNILLTIIQNQYDLNSMPSYDDLNFKPSILSECMTTSVSFLRRFGEQYDSIILQSIQQYILGPNGAIRILNGRGRAALSFILGEYSNKIPDSSLYIDSIFADAIQDECYEAQLASMTAAVKIFICQNTTKETPDNENETEVGSDSSQENISLGSLKAILTSALVESESPDVKERALLYAHILSECSDKASDILGVSSNSESFLMNLREDCDQIISDNMVDLLLPLAGSLANVYIKEPIAFVPGLRRKLPHIKAPNISVSPQLINNQKRQSELFMTQSYNLKLQAQRAQQILQTQNMKTPQNQSNISSSNIPMNSPVNSPNAAGHINALYATQMMPLRKNQPNYEMQPVQLPPQFQEMPQNQIQITQYSSDSDSESSSGSSSSYGSSSNEEEEEEESTSTYTSISEEIDPALLIGDERNLIKVNSLSLLMKARPSNYLLEVYGNFIRMPSDKLCLALYFTNFGEELINVKKIEMSKNIFALSLFKKLEPSNSFPIPSDQNSGIVVGKIIPSKYAFTYIQDSEFINVTVHFEKLAPITFQVLLNLTSVLVTAENGGKMTKMEFMNHFKTVPEENTLSDTIEDVKIQSIEEAQQKLIEHRLFFIARKGTEGFFSGKTVNGHSMVVIFDFLGDNKCDVTVRMENLAIGSIMLSIIAKYLIQ
ncbi:hypothetical protein TRFO_14279 [Tritrichomonas foetus]|uniref:Uncharacterized protein n=1 Tax=Tritrichomonas foetus TaxID=1144522 RepID=A0A1J4KVI0_9EUKA|nr:hypothetical protein TRFO_14279 [Tritrichomonas foetus]|eukprot:OHT15243.1 hypothetical protein TRFO_14279 [Tritrichomonas foetus]